AATLGTLTRPDTYPTCKVYSYCSIPPLPERSETVKVSTRGEYGMRAMVELSRQYGQGPTPLSAVAKASSVPPAYLEQLIAPLRNAGLVVATRGAHGGYELARDPDSINIGEVYRVL